jgi:hypothetical protein
MVSLLPVSNSQPTERDPMNSPSTTALGSHMIPTVHWNLTEQLICMWWCQHSTRLAKPMEKKPTSSNSFTPKKSSCSGYSGDGGERLRSCSSLTPLERKRLRWGRASGGGLKLDVGVLEPLHACIRTRTPRRSCPRRQCSRRQPRAVQRCP